MRSDYLRHGEFSEKRERLLEPLFRDPASFWEECKRRVASLEAQCKEAWQTLGNDRDKLKLSLDRWFDAVNDAFAALQPSMTAVFRSAQADERMGKDFLQRLPCVRRAEEALREAEAALAAVSLSWNDCLAQILEETELVAAARCEARGEVAETLWQRLDLIGADARAGERQTRRDRIRIGAFTNRSLPLFWRGVERAIRFSEENVTCDISALRQRCLEVIGVSKGLMTEKSEEG